MNFFAKDTVSESQEYLLLQADKLSLAFITGKSDSVMLRVDSAQSDYLQIALVKYQEKIKEKIIKFLYQFLGKRISNHVLQSWN